MNNLVADGALHEHEVELLLLVLHRVLFAGLSTDETHSSVGQDGLDEKRAERRVGSFKQNLCYRLYMSQYINLNADINAFKTGNAVLRVSVRGAEAFICIMVSLRPSRAAEVKKSIQ